MFMPLPAAICRGKCHAVLGAVLSCPPSVTHEACAPFWLRQKILALFKIAIPAAMLRGPGWKVPRGVLFEFFWAPGSECPKESFWRCFFFAFFELEKRQKVLKKHSLGHFESGAQKHSKSTLRGTFQAGPLSTLANGGRDRKFKSLSD